MTSLLICAPLWADESDIFNASVAETIVRDNNLFRVADGASSIMVQYGIPARADTIHTETAGFTLDKAYSLQHFHVGANLANNHFETFSFLNYQAKGFDARWDWSLTPHLAGKFSAEKSQSLNSFSDNRNFDRNVRTTDSRNATIDYDVFGTWHILGGTGHNKIEDTSVLPTGNTATNFAEAGIKYASSNGSSVALFNRTSRISWLNVPLDYFLQLDVAAVQHDSEVQLNWQFTGKSQIYAVVTRLNRTHQNFSSRDFSGTAGIFNYVWSPGGKAQILFSASRNYVDWWDMFSSYNIADSVSLMPIWQLSSEVSAKLRVERSKRNFFAPIFSYVGMPMRQDTGRSAQFSLDWMPMRNISLGVSLQKERRNSNAEDLNYADTTAMVNTRLSF
jgi:exopolysaccharide biosynthesis operon protein EpsL